MKKTLAFCMAAVMAGTLPLSMTALADGDAKDTMVVIDSEWYGTDMFQQDGWASAQSLIADSLFTEDPKTGDLLDGICTDWKLSDDGLTATFNVPEGKYYATGEQVEPEDVVASLEYGKEVSPYADGYSNIESMDVDGRQVTLHLSSFRSDMLYNLAACFIGVIDKDQLDSMDQDELMWGAVPYGQYSVESYEPGTEVVLVPNEGYSTDNPLVENKGVGKMSSIKVKFSKEEFTELEELKSGDADITFSLSMDGKAELEGADGITIQDATYPNIEYFELNTTSGIFSDIEVRKAVAYAIDRDALCDLTDGAAVPAYSMIYDSVTNFSQDAKDDFMNNYCNDQEKAKQILADAGYEDSDGDGILEKDGTPLEFTFYTRSSGTSIIMAQGLQEQMAEIGIQMDIESIDWNYIYESISDDDYDAGIEVLEWAEPMLVLNCCYYDKDAPGNNDDYSASVEDAATTIDSTERTQKIGEIQSKMFENLDIIPFYSEVSYFAYRSELQGINVLENGTVFFNDFTF